MASKRVAKPKVVSPKTVRNLWDLPRTCKDLGDSWMLLTENGDLVICNQRNGKDATGKVKLTRREFEAFIRFYETPQRPLTKRERG